MEPVEQLYETLLSTAVYMHFVPDERKAECQDAINLISLEIGLHPDDNYERHQKFLRERKQQVELESTQGCGMCWNKSDNRAAFEVMSKEFLDYALQMGRVEDVEPLLAARKKAEEGRSVLTKARRRKLDEMVVRAEAINAETATPDQMKKQASCLVGLDDYFAGNGILCSSYIDEIPLPGQISQKEHYGIVLRVLNDLLKVGRK